MATDYVEQAWERVVGAEPSRCCVFADMRQPDQPLVYVTDAFLDHTGYAREDIVGRNCRFLQGAETDEAARTFMRRVIDNEQSALVEILNYRKTGEPFWNRLSLSPIYDPAGVLTHYSGIQVPFSGPTGNPRLEILP